MTSLWTIRLLGGISLEGPRGIRRFRTQKTASLLGFLAYHLRQSHPRERLVDLLWPESDLDAGRASLRVSLTSLRHQLEPPGIPAGTVLLADRAAVQLNPECVETDVRQFEAALRDGERWAREPASGAEPGEGLEASLRRAVDLYGGELLPGCYDDWVFPERDRLAGRYCRALAGLVRCRVAQGDLDGALEVARRAVAAEPVNEDAHQQLIRLLVATRQPEAARRQFGQLERILRQELGSSPSAVTRELLRAVPGSAPTGGAARPRAASPRAGLPQRPGPGLAAPASVRPQPRESLPVPLTRFFGRDREMAGLRSLLLPPDADAANPGSLPATRLVTITGPAGIGKTRLAIEAARDLAGRCAGRVWFLSLAETDDAQRFLDALQSTLALRHDSGAPLLDGIAAALAGGPAVLVLDNFEQLVESAADLVGDLLERVGDLRCLITSQQRLRVPGEREFALEPLETTGGSVPLFVDRAQSIRPDFQLTPRNAAALAELCARLEGIPLALELAAARIQVFTVAQMLSRVRNRLDFLETRQRGVSPRHRTLRAAIDWSYRLLAPEDQRLFATLSVFREGWTAEAAAAVGQTAPENLGRLVDGSLVAEEETAAGMRFRMLESLREFASEQLPATARKVALARHAAFFLALAERSAPGGEARTPAAAAGSGDWLDRLAADYENLRQALETLGATGPVAGLRMAVALAGYWKVRGPFADGRQCLQSALAAAGEHTPFALRAAALAASGHLAWQQCDYPQARSLFEESLATARHREDDDGIAAALHGLGMIANNEGDMETVFRLNAEALKINRSTGNRAAQAANLEELATVALQRGNHFAANSLHQETLVIHRALGDRLAEAGSLHHLGIVARARGCHHAARSFHLDSLAIRRELGHAIGAAASLACLGQIARGDGDMETARSCCEESCRLFAELGNRRDHAGALCDLAEVLLDQGRLPEARAALEQALEVDRALRYRRGEARALHDLARVALAEGDPGSARSAGERSLAIRLELHDDRGVSDTLAMLEAAGALVHAGGSAPSTPLR